MRDEALKLWLVLSPPCTVGLLMLSEASRQEVLAFVGRSWAGCSMVYSIGARLSASVFR